MTTTINNEHEKNQGQKVLNVPNSTDKGKTIRNVPHLRFPEFQGEWSVTTLQKDCKVNPTNEKIADKFVYVDLESVTQGQLNKHQILTKEEAPSRAQRVLHTDDILFQCVRPYQMNNYMVKDAMSNIQWVASTGYAQIRTQIDYPTFLYYVLNTPKYNKAVMVRCTGSSYPAINSDDLSKIPFYKCSIAEQRKIATFLSLLDERIATQTKIIDKLQSLIKGLRVRLVQIEKGNIVHLNEIASIYQPQTISSTELTEDGFCVYGANGIIGKYKNYNHKTEQICITCRGNTCGMVNYTKPMSWITGNAMVINTDEHQDDVCKRYLFHYLSAYNFNRIISGSGQPQIVRTPLEKLKITLPSILEQEQKAMLLDKIQAKIEVSNSVLNLYQEQKQYLLRQIFI